MRKVILTLSAVAIGLIALLAGLAGTGAHLPQIMTSPTSWLFDPARYGVPDTIAGHKVLAVLSADNTMCTPPHDLTLIVRVGSPDPQSYQGSSESQDLNAAMAEFSHPGWTWVLDTIGPDVRLDSFLSEIERWNQQMKISGCIQYARPKVGTP